MNGNYGWFLPVQASDFAAAVDQGIRIMHWAMGLIFVLWGIFFAYLLMKYRARPGHKADLSHPSLAASIAPDIIVLAFEILLVVVYAVPGWSRMKRVPPPADKAVPVEVRGEQFNWSVRYPGPDGKFGATKAELVDFTNPFGLDPEDSAGSDDTVTVNELRLPVNEPVLVRLTSKDVIHSFFIPEFRVKQDAVPGLVVPVWFTPTLEGDFEISCAQLCGVGHAIMRADVKVTSRAAFDEWLGSKRAASAAAAPKPAAAEEF